MNHLTQLRGRLRSLWWRRRALDLAAAACSSLTAIIWALLCLFVLDAIFQMDPLQRIVAIAVAGLTTLWFIVKAVWPLVAVREDGIDLALLVEQQHSIANDLVAALQFDANPPSNAGSQQLRSAVVQQAANWSGRMRVANEQTYRAAWRCAARLLLGLLAAGLVTGSFPQHVRIFANRLSFGSQAYPTATSIDRLVINQTSVLGNGGAPRPYRLAEDSPVQFWIRASGRLPDTGGIELKSDSPGQRRTIALTRLRRERRIERLDEARSELQRVLRQGVPAEDPTWHSRLLGLLQPDAPDAASELAHVVATTLPTALAKLDLARNRLAMAGEPNAVYQGRINRMTTSLGYTINLGDARVRPGRLGMIPLPIVELEGEVIPPAYTNRRTEIVSPGTLQFSVFEGSTVHLRLRSRNKSLRAAWFTLDEQPRAMRLKLVAQDSSGRLWRCNEPPHQLIHMNQETTFQFQIIDEDHLSLKQPMQGVIRIRHDQPPTATLTTIHDVVVPSANPTLDYRVADDIAISELRLHLGVATRETSDDADPRPTAEPPATQRHSIQIPFASDVPRWTELPLIGQFALDLAPLGAVSGDQVVVVLEVVDDRGGTSGRSVRTKPLTLEVADEADVLHAVSALDKQTEQRLSEIIRQQLDVRRAP